VTPTDQDFRTVLVLMKGSDSDATIDALETTGQDVVITDEGPYWKIQGRGDIVVEMADVEAELGAPITLAKWLVSMTSFVGYADKSDTHFTVHAERGAAVNRE